MAIEYFSLSAKEKLTEKLIKAIREENLGLVNRSIDEGAPVNGNLHVSEYVRSDNFTYFIPLNIAAYVGNIDVVKALINAGARVNIVSDLYELMPADSEFQKDYEYSCLGTPLNMAIRAGYLDIIELLIDAGAELNPKFPHTKNTDFSASPLYFAYIRGSDPRIIELLKDAGAKDLPDSLMRNKKTMGLKSSFALSEAPVNKRGEKTKYKRKPVELDNIKIGFEGGKRKSRRLRKTKRRGTRR